MNHFRYLVPNMRAFVRALNLGKVTDRSGENIHQPSFAGAIIGAVMRRKPMDNCSGKIGLAIHEHVLFQHLPDLC